MCGLMLTGVVVIGVRCYGICGGDFFLIRKVKKNEEGRWKGKDGGKWHRKVEGRKLVTFILLYLLSLLIPFTYTLRRRRKRY